MSKTKIKGPNVIHIPCLKGKMGDWFYYIGVLSFGDVAKRIKLPREIDEKYDDEKLKLGEWIQRKIENNRIKNISNYLIKTDQRFFNSLVLGIYDGRPTWQEIDVQKSEIYDDEREGEDENQLDYLSKTFGILSLNGDESIFAIDGQHRAYSIRKAISEKPELKSDELPVIFLAHKTDADGLIRTRRLFSTLNKYAKPVSQSEIIALSEDNNCSIITRQLVDEYPLLKGKILVIKNRSINPDNTGAFTNIMTLYDIVERLLTDKTIAGTKVQGLSKNSFTTERQSEDEIAVHLKKVKKILEKVIYGIPELKRFFKTGYVNRNEKKTSLLFRPIGQNVFFNVLKVAIEHNKSNRVIEYFSKDKFNLSNTTWNKIFWDSETQNIVPDKSRQRYATLLLLEHFEFDIKKSKKDLEIFDNFKIDPKRI